MYHLTINPETLEGGSINYTNAFPFPALLLYGRIFCYKPEDCFEGSCPRLQRLWRLFVWMYNTVDLMKAFILLIFVVSFTTDAVGQSGRVSGYSESPSERIEAPAAAAKKVGKDDDVVRVETDLVTIPVRVSERGGRPVTAIAQTEFKIFENEAEQQIAYFSNDDQPFTVVLLLDMSYSSVFKLRDIQTAAKIFVTQLRPQDRVTVVSFAERITVLCEATNDRKILDLAIDGSKIASGTSLYDALGVALNDKLRSISGRKAIVLLSDGVDTTSSKLAASDLTKDFAARGVIIYPIQYATFDDVRDSRRKDAEVRYDDDDRKYTVEAPLEKGQRESDYLAADEFISQAAEATGGTVFRVSSRTNLAKAFSQIAE